MRKFTNERNLVKPANTRFTTAFLTLEAMYKQRKNLRRLIISNEWSSSKFAKEVSGKEVSAILYSTYFWNDLVKALKVCGPFVSFHRLVDGKKDLQWFGNSIFGILCPSVPMSYMVEAMDKAKETIQRGFDGVSRHYQKVLKIIDSRWTNKLKRPLHSAEYVLNSGLYFRSTMNEEKIAKVWESYYTCIETMVPDLSTQDLLLAELATYKTADGLFGSGQTVRARDTRSHPIHSKKRNKLELSRLNDLVYVKYNRTLTRHYDIHDTIDLILLENIEDANEWLLVGPEDQEDELVYEEGDFNWVTIAMAAGADDGNVNGLWRKSSSIFLMQAMQQLKLSEEKIMPLMTALNGIKVVDKTLIVRRANQGTTQPEPEQESRLVLQCHALATKVVCLTQVVEVDELSIDDDNQDILEDMRTECGKFASLVNVVVLCPGPTGEHAPGVGVFGVWRRRRCQQCSQILTGRKFGGSQVVAVFYPENKFNEGDFDGVAFWMLQRHNDKRRLCLAIRHWRVIPPPRTPQLRHVPIKSKAGNEVGIFHSGPFIPFPAIFWYRYSGIRRSRVQALKIAFGRNASSGIISVRPGSTPVTNGLVRRRENFRYSGSDNFSGTGSDSGQPGPAVPIPVRCQP
ncbi:hypothetical protein FXO37_10533 [Capsicum annuum]|nr:hypothetical protein FXO37_10533 [Capsicum annuum]